MFALFCANCCPWCCGTQIADVVPDLEGPGAAEEPLLRGSGSTRGQDLEAASEDPVEMLIPGPRQPCEHRTEAIPFSV